MKVNGHNVYKPNVTLDEMRAVSRVAIAEAVFGYERRMDRKTGSHQWRGVDPETGITTDWIQEGGLPDILDSTKATVLATKIAIENSLLLQTIFEPLENNRHAFTVVFGARNSKQKGRIETVEQFTSADFGVAVCGAIAKLYEVPIEDYHRMLFPLRYMSGTA